MAHYVKGRDGKFAGSVGDGKTNVPTAAPAVPAGGPLDSTGQTLRDIDERHAAWRLSQNQRGVPAWAVTPRCQRFDFKQATDWDEDWVVTKSEEHDRLPDPGSPIEHDCTRVTLSGALRIEKIDGSDWVDENNQNNSYWKIPSVGPDTDGSIAVIRYSHDDRKIVQSYSTGMLSPDGTFSVNMRGDTRFSDQMAYESPVREQAQAYLDDLTYSLACNADGTPGVMEFTAVSEWFEDSDYEPDPDWAYDSWRDEQAERG